MDRFAPPPIPLIQRLPSLVPFVGPETLERRLGRRFSLRLGANESNFGPSASALAAMAEAASQGQNYGDPEGLELRTAIAEKHGVKPENVVLGSGIDELLVLFARVYAEVGAPVLTTLGSYLTFEYAVTGVGATIHRVPYQADQVDLAGLSAGTLDHLPRLVYLANPDNPSGSMLPPGRIEAFLAELPTGVLVLLDEAYSDYVPADSLPRVAADDPQVIRLRTFSKAHGMAGLRIGYAIGHPAHVAELNKIRLHFGVNSVAQAGALASLTSP